MLASPAEAVLARRPFLTAEQRGADVSNLPDTRPVAGYVSTESFVSRCP